MDELGKGCRQPNRSGPRSVSRTSLPLCGPDPSSLPCSFHTPFVPLMRKTLLLSTSIQTIWVQLLIINNTRQGWLPQDQLLRPFPSPARNLPSGGERLVEAISGIDGSAEIDSDKRGSVLSSNFKKYSIKYNIQRVQGKGESNHPVTEMRD